MESSEHAITVLIPQSMNLMTSHGPLLKDNLPWNVNSWQVGLLPGCRSFIIPKKIP